MRMASEPPQGLRCPGCGGSEVMVLGDPATAVQVFCANEDCHVFSWNPRHTFAELNAEATFVELTDGEPTDGPGHG